MLLTDPQAFTLGEKIVPGTPIRMGEALGSEVTDG